MAKKLIEKYTFNAAAGTIGIDNNFSLEELLLITNVTDNIIIYNFGDPTKGAVKSYDPETNQTTFALTYDTSSMSDTDRIQVYIENGITQITPFGAYSDPVDKLRVSNPQALIDTDFEYSLQPTKWETTQLQCNIPGIYQKANEPAFTAEQIVSITSEQVSSTPTVAGITYDTALESYTYDIVENRGTFDGSDTSTSGAAIIPFNVTIGGVTFNQVRANAEGVLFLNNTFATTSAVNLQNANYVTSPHLKIFARNMSVLRYDDLVIGTAPNRQYIFKWSGGDGVLNQVAYVIFSEGSNNIEVHYQNNENRGTVGLSDGSQFLLQWVPTQNTVSPFFTRDAFLLTLDITVRELLRVEVTQAPIIPLFVGQPIIMKETADTAFLDRSFIITQLGSTTVFYLDSQSPVTYTTNQATPYTTIYTGGFYYSSEIPITSINRISGTTNLSITFASNHSLFLESTIYVVDSTSSDTDWIGAFTVNKVLSSTQVEYRALRNTNYIDNAAVSTAQTKVYVRNNGSAQHRFYDGGVQISPEGFTPNCQIIRQTRKYFRYQSGKGIQFSTGILFRPIYDVTLNDVDTNDYEAGVYDFYNMTITTDQIHGFKLPGTYLGGALVSLRGFEVSSGTNPYNVTNVQIVSVNSAKQFTVAIPVVAGQLPTDLSPGGLARIEVTGWRDATVRSGMFDAQNGIYLEHDGVKLSAVLRTSTTQISGTISVNENSSIVTGTFTKFKSQLNENDYIVIKGISFIVTDIQSDTSLTIAPDFTGLDVSNIKIVKTTEVRTDQNNFSLDKLDGTGPSKYIFNSNKMQMIFIDYSWYGAGKIRYGMRGIDGRVNYFHEIVNNNVNTEAFMRSGNLPARFEIQTRAASGKIKSALTAVSTQVEIPTSEAVNLPTKGTIIVNYEYMQYTKGTTSGDNTILLLDNRNLGNLTAGNATADINDGYISYNQNFSPTLSHWGVSVIMDGRFDIDKSYLFTAANAASISVATTTERPILSIRLAPSVDYGVPGFYSVRNLINRSSLVLSQIQVITDGQLTLVARINGDSTLFGNDANWQPAGNGSIAQYLDHTTTAAVSGGDVIGIFLTSANTAGTNQFDISAIRDLGNSILGGPNTFPDGPDTLTIFAKNDTAATRAILARISWQESQG